mmetsp:Transcript_83036/g.240245  ORF Transcript_83036/g.240245 Transcript_83036/m.240245 type:complete len:219 (+) Transcript_83036:132-788(+)
MRCALGACCSSPAPPPLSPPAAPPSAKPRRQRPWPPRPPPPGPSSPLPQRPRRGHHLSRPLRRAVSVKRRRPRSSLSSSSLLRPRRFRRRISATQARSERPGRRCPSFTRSRSRGACCGSSLCPRSARRRTTRSRIRRTAGMRWRRSRTAATSPCRIGATIGRSSWRGSKASTRTLSSARGFPFATSTPSSPTLCIGRGAACRPEESAAPLASGTKTA